MDNLIISHFFLGLTLVISPIDSLDTQAETIQQQSPLNLQIQQEVNPTLERIYPLLNFWILVAVLVPTSATICLLILGFKAFKKNQQTQQSLNTVKSDLLSQINTMMSETQPLIDDLQDSIQVTEAKIHQMQSQGFGVSPAPENSSNNSELNLSKAEGRGQEAGGKNFFPLIDKRVESP